VARRHHPDLGGDPSTFACEIDAVDRSFGLGVPAETTGPSFVVVAAPSGWTRTRRVLNRGLRRSRQGLRRLRGSLPRSVPGARRYINL
jgi:hypothetical protein